MGQLADLGGVILLGVIQGLTEFLPVSSSGHLVVGQQLLDLAPPSLVFDLLLHVGTLLPVAWLYRRDLAAMVASLARLPQLGRRLGDDGALRLTVCVLVGSLPTALIGVSLKDFFEGLFSSVLAVGCAFLVTGAVLLVTRRRGTLEPDERALSLTPPSDRKSVV